MGGVGDVAYPDLESLPPPTWLKRTRIEDLDGALLAISLSGMKEEQVTGRVYRSLLSCAFSGGTPQAGPKSQLGFHQALEPEILDQGVAVPDQYLCTVSSHGLAL